MKSFFITIILAFAVSVAQGAERIVSQSPFITYTLKYLGADD